MDLHKTDCETLLYHMKRQEKELKRKRRWLMGLSTSKSEQEQLRIPKFLKNRCLPESLLREDDLFYETIKRCVEEAYGECDVEGEQHVLEDNQVVDLPNISRIVMSCLDDMNNKGLYHIAMILTGGTDRFENIRWKMEKVIRESLTKISENQNQDNYYREISRQVSQILSNPHYFRHKSATVFTKASHPRNAAIKILDGLEDLPFQTLIAMHRKIRGVQGSVPRLNCRRSGWNRDILINQVRKTCEKWLSKLGEGDELQEPLAKAMAVARLSLKLRTGFQNPNVAEFQQYSPEIVTLQNEIAKAIWLLDNKVRYLELKNLHILLDPDAKISSGCLRSAIKKLLTEYLFDCNDMDTIPKPLSETLAIINQSSRSMPYRCFPKEEVEEEVECILSISAQTKQIVLDLLPDKEYDQDFNSAYMEDLEESDDDDGDDDDDLQQLLLKYSQRDTFQCNDSLLECIGDSNPINSKSLTYITEGNGSFFGNVGNGSSLHLTSDNRLDGDFVQQAEAARVSERLNGSEEPERDVIMDSANSPDPFSSSLSSGQEKIVPNKQSTCKSQYLAIQELCDDTSMIAYHLVGRTLNEYARIDGFNLDLSDELYLRGNSSIPEDSKDTKVKHTSSMEDVDGSFIIRVVEELIPSFSHSRKEKLKKLMSLL